MATEEKGQKVIKKHLHIEPLCSLLFLPNSKIANGIVEIVLALVLIQSNMPEEVVFKVYSVEQNPDLVL